MLFQSRNLIYTFIQSILDYVLFIHFVIIDILSYCPQIPVSVCFDFVLVLDFYLVYILWKEWNIQYKQYINKYYIFIQIRKIISLELNNIIFLVIKLNTNRSNCSISIVLFIVHWEDADFVSSVKFNIWLYIMYTVLNIYIIQ